MPIEKWNRPPSRHLNWRREAKKIRAVYSLNRRTLNREMDSNLAFSGAGSLGRDSVLDHHPGLER